MKKYDTNYMIELFNLDWTRDPETFKQDIVYCTDGQLTCLLRLCEEGIKFSTDLYWKIFDEQNTLGYSEPFRKVKEELKLADNVYETCAWIIDAEQHRREHFKSMAFDYDGLAA